MNEIAFAALFAAVAGFGLVWSLRTAPDLNSRISPELVFRSGTSKSGSQRPTWPRFSLKTRKSTPGNLQLEVSDLGSVLGLALANGETPVGAIDWVSHRVRGDFGHRLRQTVLALRTGSSLNTELALIAKQKKFAPFAETLDRLARSTQLGTDVSAQVQTLADSAISAYRVQLLAQQSRIELRMLLPLVFLILPTTILFAVYPSLHMMQLMQF